MKAARDTATSIQGRFAARVGGLAADRLRPLGRHKKRAAPVDGKGMLLVGSEAFRRVCAINEDGTY